MNDRKVRDQDLDAGQIEWRSIGFTPAPPGWRAVAFYPTHRRVVAIAGWLLQEECRVDDMEFLRSVARDGRLPETRVLAAVCNNANSFGVSVDPLDDGSGPGTHAGESPTAPGEWIVLAPGEEIPDFAAAEAKRAAQEQERVRQRHMAQNAAAMTGSFM